MRNILITVSLLIFIGGCGGPISQFYPDSYFSEDNIYQNKPLRFSLTFQGNWDIETNPNKMRRSLQKLAREFQKQGIELLFIGSTVDALQGVQGVAINLNASTREYAETYRDINKSYMTTDSGLTDIIINNKPMVRWNYVKYGFQFIEFFFTLDTYNIRIAFWSKPNIFKRFLPVYFNIMSSLDFISRY